MPSRSTRLFTRPKLANSGSLVNILRQQRPGENASRRPAQRLVTACLEWSTLIEVKHTERNFGAGDFRQVLMYWLLRYARTVENDSAMWSDVLLLNPRRNGALLVNYDHLLRSASASSNRVELVELLRSAVAQDFDRR